MFRGCPISCVTDANQPDTLTSTAQHPDPAMLASSVRTQAHYVRSHAQRHRASGSAPITSVRSPPACTATVSPDNADPTAVTALPNPMVGCSSSATAVKPAIPRRKTARLRRRRSPLSDRNFTIRPSEPVGPILRCHRAFVPSGGWFFTTNPLHRSFSRGKRLPQAIPFDRCTARRTVHPTGYAFAYTTP